MSSLDENALFLRDRVLASPRKGNRRVVAIAGPPGSGKSTLAERLSSVLNGSNCPTQIVPMDGFHLDNSILINRNLLHRKGAPETFDVNGFLSLAKRLANADEVFYPLFDRKRDISIAGAGLISPDCDTVLVEGNYLTMNLPNWRNLSRYWDMSIALQTPEAELRKRLIQRWLDQGLSPSMAEARAEENDLPNARLVLDKLTVCDVYI